LLKHKDPTRHDTHEENRKDQTRQDDHKTRLRVSSITRHDHHKTKSDNTRQSQDRQNNHKPKQSQDMAITRQDKIKQSQENHKTRICQDNE
jgi:hypothetical protein